MYMQSGRLTLLKNITNFTCYEPEIDIQLNKEGSVTIYQASCKNLKTRTYPLSRKSLPYENVSEPTIVLSEDFVNNYFLKGEIEVRVNTTFDTATEIYLCLFTDVEAFEDFTNYDKDWRQYIDKAIECNHTSEEQFTSTFKVVSPDYVFIAMASTNVLKTLQFSFNGTRQNFDQSQSEITEVCSLTSDKPSESNCQFTVDGASKDLCILASNAAHVDGSIDYFTISLTFPNVKRHTNIGIAFTVPAIVVLGFVGILVVIIIVATVRRCR